MLNTAVPSPLAQELATSHVLMMQCGAAALRMLDSAQSAGGTSFDLRAGDEAVRMAGLSARLMGHHREGLRLLRRLPPANRGESLVPAPTAASQPESASEPKAVSPAALRKCHAEPGAARGRLRNGNPSGDYLKSPRCGACTRIGGCCRQPAMANGRCRIHGGLSTGPRTPEGLARCRTTRLVHGYRTRAHIGLRSRAAHAARRLRDLTAQLRASSAGHGLHRSDSRCQMSGIRHQDANLIPSIKHRTAATPLISDTCHLASDTAGHGLHRSNSANRGDAEAQRAPVAQSAPRSSSSSVSLRLCGESSSSAAALSAGHGLHRSMRDHLRSSASICGSTPPMRNFVLQSDAALR
jgi:hypothetical protein